MSLRRQHTRPLREPIGSALRGHLEPWSEKDVFLSNIGTHLPFEAALCSLRTEFSAKTLAKPKNAQRHSFWCSATLKILLLIEISIFEPHRGHNSFHVCVNMPRKEKFWDTCVMASHHVSVSEVKVTGTWNCVFVYCSTEYPIVLNLIWCCLGTEAVVNAVMNLRVP